MNRKPLHTPVKDKSIYRPHPRPPSLVPMTIVRIFLSWRGERRGGERGDFLIGQGFTVITGSNSLVLYFFSIHFNSGF